MAPGDETSPEVPAPPAAPSNNGTDSPAQKSDQSGGRNNNRKGDMGRSDYSRKLKNDKKRSKKEDWREFKRRKVTDTNGESDKKNPFSTEEIAAEERRPKRKVAVMIGYSGTGYKGMQVNGDEPTIERDLFQAFIDAKAISKANADDPRKSSLARCARTDKGVHAAGNVISLKLIIEDEDIVEQINAKLPEQIRVWGIQRTNNSFNCYQYCDSRWYEYLLPSYCLLPPHPQTFLGKKLDEVNKEYGAEAEMAAKMGDVKNFWEDVEEKEIKPILAALTPELRAEVLENVHAQEYVHPDQENADSAPETPAAQGSERPKVQLETVKPRHRELRPVDFALRDIKAAYVSAKRRYRISEERLQALQAVLNKYEGTNNFHNYTVQKKYSDPSAKRHIKSFVVNPKPIIIGDTEWLSLKVHGQSFMMHQIRKMVGLATLVVRCGTSLDRVADSYRAQKMAIPKAPGLGLLLERPVFSNYNRRAKDELGRDGIDFAKYDEKLLAFKEKHIYSRIFEVEERENTFHGFYNQIDQFKSNHFLWLSAGGMKMAELNKDKNETVDVDKALGDEDEEDPEGGEG